MRASLEELSGQSFLYVSGGHRGQDVLRHVLASSAWRPGLIAVVSDSVPLGAAAECDGVPVVAVPTEHTPDAWWAMAAHGIKGVLAVGVPPDLLEELSQKAFPLGVYGLQAGLLPGTAGPAALNWALIRGLTETAVSARGLTLDFPDGRIRISDLSLDDGAEIPGHLLAALAERVGARLSSLHTGQKVLVVAAHPDDEVLGIGGTMIRHFKSGDEIRAAIVCSAESIRYREGEHDQPGDTQRASHDLGAQSIGLELAAQRLDRGSNLELIQALERQIQEFQPHVIYTHWWGDVNADHARVAEAVDVAARPYSAPGVKSIYAFETPSSTEWTASARGRVFAPNVFVDISEELDRKLDAMRCYESELRPPPHPRSLRSLQQRAAYWGSVANMPAAEALTLLRTRQ